MSSSRFSRCLGATLVCAALLPTASLRAQSTASTLVLPAGYDKAEGETLMFWSLTPFPSRRQLLIDQKIMAPLAAQELTAIELRRDGGNFDLPGGRLNITIQLSHSSRSASAASAIFSENRGSSPVTFFRGIVDVPSHAGHEKDPAPWAKGSSIELKGLRPFPLLGKTLCIETQTTAPAARSNSPNAPDWPIDAMRGPRGSVDIRRGNSCLPGNAEVPASVDMAESVIGGQLAFRLQMPVLAPQQAVGQAFLLWGFDGSRFGALELPLDLGSFGAPGCFLQQEVVGVVGTPTRRLPQSSIELAEIVFPTPRDRGAIGLDIHAQWLRFGSRSPRGSYSLSNGVRATLGEVPSGFGYAVVATDNMSNVSGRIERARIPILRLHLQRL